MNLEEAYDDALQSDLQQSKSQIRDQSDHIQALEQQLSELNQMAENGKSATQLINQWIDEGKVAVDENNVPNIIHNAEDLSEVPMNASK